VSDFLQEMADLSVQRARAVREQATVMGLDSRVESARPPAPLQLSESGFDVIAEAKLASPSEGELVEGSAGSERVVSLAAAYAAHGAAAISVLTEPTRFSGAIEHLETVAGSETLPVLRKDFLVDPIQVLEARAAGASGILLIARMLPRELLAEMTDQSLDLGMFVLVEVFDRSDLETAVRVFDREVLVGVNCRDLATLDVDLSRFESLAPHLPDHLPAVAESGMTAVDHVAAVADLGYRMALIGSSLVSSPDPGKAVAEYIAAGRRRLSEAPR
jgi:indole-3-glycerol phosphate synthase